MLDPYERNRLGDVTKDKVLKKGETVFNEGDNSDAFYILSEGEVKLSKGGKDIAVLKDKGDYFGELGLIHKLPR